MMFMEEFEYTCPVCLDTITLGTYQPDRTMCPKCKVKQAQTLLLEENKKRKALYQSQRKDGLTPQRRPLTVAQLADALFDISIKEQLVQCQKCIFSAGKGINMFCDYLTQCGHSRIKGNGPGDCRSFRPHTIYTKTDHRKPVSFK